MFTQLAAGWLYLMNPSNQVFKFGEGIVDVNCIYMVVRKIFLYDDVRKFELVILRKISRR